MIDDDLIWPHVDGLLSTVVAELEKRGLPPLCFADIVPGPQAAYDYCAGQGCGGMLWLRIGQVFPSTDFDNNQGFQKGVPYKLHAFEIEIGVVRAAPVASRTGQAPTADQQHAASRIQMADMKAIRCAAAKFFNDHELDYTPSFYIPAGGGGCVGGNWTFRVRQEP